MHHTLLALALAAAAAAPALAQTALTPAPLPGARTCGEFAAMDAAARLVALSSIQPLGGALAGAEPDLAREWSDDVAAACDGTPERPLADAAAQALGAD